MDRAGAQIVLPQQMLANRIKRFRCALQFGLQELPPHICESRHCIQTTWHKLKKVQVLQTDHLSASMPDIPNNPDSI